MSLNKPCSPNDALADLLGSMRCAPAEKVAGVLFALGMSDDQVAKSIGLDVLTVELFRESTVEHVSAVQAALAMPVERRLAVAMAQAVDVKMKLLATGDDKMKNAVSTEILDRNLGKPVQTTQSLSVVANVGGKQIDKQLEAVNNRLQLLMKKRDALTLSGTNNVKPAQPSGD